MEVKERKFMTCKTSKLCRSRKELLTILPTFPSSFAEIQPQMQQFKYPFTTFPIPLKVIIDEEDLKVLFIVPKPAYYFFQRSNDMKIVIKGKNLCSFEKPLHL